MYWNNTTGNVHQTQVALKFLCSHRGWKQQPQRCYRSIRVLQKDVIHYSLIKKFLPIYLQLKISNFRQDLRDY